MRKRTKSSPEVRECAVRLVEEHCGGYPSLWAVVESIAPRIGCISATLLRDVMVIVPLIHGTINEPVWKILEGKCETEINVVEVVTAIQTDEAAVITNAALQRWVQGGAATTTVSDQLS